MNKLPSSRSDNNTENVIKSSKKMELVPGNIIDCACS